ncbi:MAG: bifunctional 5,10-methylenetetrahydrofolate dehydrogenase/5,10-methenyltetrahydrofolate cyclohydrolase [Oscillospiraceae bacterium]|nr:bifunctional 5,10-methylenetetrahydrofolate dehydrogenase/5,10-methenyltetrahydrofolate cyclohydrolase [Oscillospiraceae bacterium]
MAEIWKGKPVADAMTARMQAEASELSARGVTPTLCIFRVGERPDDLAYERGAVKRCEAVGIRVVRELLPADVSQEEFDARFLAVNRDPSVHGILLFRPLPAQLDGEKARRMLDPAKDVDGCTDASLAGVFTGSGIGFAPCTAQAAMELLRHYGVDPKGKRAAVIGRSLVIGRPVAMLLMHGNATVTVCHTRTADVPAVTRQAEILISAAGVLRSVTPDFVNPDQIVVDVGINWDEARGGISGDVDFDAVAPCVRAITPVPGGVGSVTTCVLADHVLQAARRTL